MWYMLIDFLIFFSHQLTHHTNQVAKESNKLMKDLAHLTVPGSEQVSVVERKRGGGGGDSAHG